MSRKPPNRPGISFEVGAKVEAQDYLKKWYPARIEKLEPENGKLLVHFERWSHRYDEWISWDSSRLRPLERPALRKEGLKDDDHHHHDKTVRHTNAHCHHTQTSTVLSPSQEFRDGEEVLARWTDCRYYPAKIEAVNKEGMYRVQFYDGVVRSVKRIHIKSMPEDAKGQDWVALVKAATATRSRSFSKPRTSNNSSRLRPDVQGDEDEDDEEEEEDEDDRETDEDDETHGGRKRREGEHKDPPTIQGVSASAGCGSSGSSVKDEPQSDSDTPPFTTDNKHNTGHTDPAPSCSLTCSQRRRSQRLAPTSDPPPDPPTHHHQEQPCAPQPAAFSQTPGASTEREESSHHNYCTWAPPTTLAQPAMEQNRVTDSPSTNHVVLEEKSPPPIAAVGVRTSSVRTPKNRHAREPILSSLRAPEPPSSSGAEEPRQFQCTLPGCSKSFRKAKLLDYHLKYYHSGSPPGLLQQQQQQHHHTPSPDRVVRTRATSASLPPVSTAHVLELLDSKRRRTVSSSSSLSPQAFHLEDVRSTVRSCGKKKRSSTSVSSDNSAEPCCPSTLPPLAPHPCSQALSPPPPPRELRLEPPHPHPHQHPHPHPHPQPHPGLISNPLQPGLIKMEKRLKMDAKHLSLGRKKDRRDRRDRDPFKLKQKKKKKKKKSKQHCYHNYDGLSLSLLEHSSSSVHHRQHGNNTAVSLPAPSSSSSSSKHLVCPRAILQVDLSGENLSEGDFPEDSTTESLPYSAEEELELDLEEEEEEDVPLQEDELSEACQEIVRCVCQMDEENGFMIQCEECMCWQHSACMGLLEDSIPDQYICYICRDPPGQRCSAKYRHDRDWLVKGHMFGLSVLSENYSKQNSQRIVSTHQLLADLFSLRHVLHGLTLKMDILQDCRSPSLQLWARSWVNSDEHQPMGGLPDCLHFLDPRLPPLPPPPHSSSPLPQPHPLPQPPPPPSSSSSSSDAPLVDTYITSEHSYQKPADPVHSPEGSLHPPGPAGGGDSAGCSTMQQQQHQSTVALPCPNWVEAGHTPGGPVEPSRTSISPVRLSQAEHQARARTRTCVQWQMNLLTHIEDVQNQLASRMDYIEKELDVLESWLDLSGGLEPPDPLARLPQLKLSIKQLLADLSKLQHISALCSV